jgi:DNA-binding NarL/FixJ family response regulator
MIQPQTSAGYFFGDPDQPGDTHLNSLNRATKAAAPQRILIVEDEALVAMNMESALTEDGFDILGPVDNEADAVAAAIRLKPDAILMDITLRDGDGISAARSILKDLATRIIFVSGNSDPMTLAAAQQLKPAGFIRKPFVTDRLASLVRNALTEKN